MAAHGRRQLPGFRLTVEWSDMCGRYNLISNLTVLGERFRFDATQLTLESAYNIAPTQDVLTVIACEPRRAGFMRWGRIPFWAKKPLHRQPHDQRQGRDGCRQTLVPRSLQTQALPRARRSSLADAREKIEAWRRYYNAEPPDGALGNLAPKTFPLKTPAVH